MRWRRGVEDAALESGAGDIVRQREVLCLHARYGAHCSVATSRSTQFGDVVNTTARMESSSQAMQVHVSDPMAQLLKQAIDRGLTTDIALEERGEWWRRC